MCNFTLRYPLIYKWTKLQKIEEDASKVWNGFTSDVIRKRRQELIDTQNNDDHNEDDIVDEIGIRKKRALIDILLHSTIDGKPLSDLDIHEEVNTYIAAVNIAFSIVSFTVDVFVKRMTDFFFFLHSFMKSGLWDYCVGHDILSV